MKQKKQIIVLVVLFAIAVGVWISQSWTPGRGTGANAAVFLQSYQPMTVANPEIRWWEIEKRRKSEYKASGGNPFSMVVPPSPEDLKKAAAAAPKIADARANEPPPPPPPPQLPPNMKFFGYGTVPNGTPRRAFLSDGDEVYIVSEGDTLMGRYRILKISNASLEFEEVGSGRRGQKMLEDQGPTA
jgi:hypothetical protein